MSTVNDRLESIQSLEESTLFVNGPVLAEPVFVYTHTVMDNPIFYLYRLVWRYSAGNRGKVVVYSALFVVANLINFLEPLIIAKLLNTIQEFGVTAQSLPTITAMLASIIGIQLGFWMFHGPARIMEEGNAFLVRAAYKKHLMNGVMSLPLEWHTDHHSGDTIDKIERGTEALFRFTESSFEIIQAIVRLTSSYLVLAYFNVSAGYIVIAMVVFTLTLIVRFDKVLVRQYRDLYLAENRISAKIFDIVSNITTVIILRVERLVASAIYQQIMKPFRLFNTNLRLNELKWFLVSMCSSVMIVGVLTTYLWSQVTIGAVILVGTLYALYGYVERISSLFYNFAYKYSEFLQQKAAVQNAELLAIDFESVATARQAKLPDDWREIRIDSLQFSYDDGEGAAKHLDDISLTIHRGDRIAFVGASGSGKTTLLKLIRELYHPLSGTIVLDGRALKHGFSDLAASIALIPQDPEIFATTVKENITLGVPHAAAYIQQFTDMACFTEVAERLPNKLESSIVEKGVNLSGGERQRLALARGLMACDDKQLVLLDEPTSSVDSKNELKIYQNIFGTFRKKTILSSIHRLHLLPLFDQICFFQGGRLLAIGTLDELIDSSKEFATLWERYHRIGKVEAKKTSSNLKGTKK